MLAYLPTKNKIRYLNKYHMTLAVCHLSQATAYEMQNLLISGRKKEALECAKLGHLWGPAIVLAAQLGDQVSTIYES